MANLFLRITAGSVPNLQDPVVGATVQLFELDNPAPAGDDVHIPATGDSDKFTPKFEITDSKTYQPRADQLLGTGITDPTGFVQFIAVAPNSSAGVLSDVRTTFDIHTGDEISRTTTTKIVPESKPDFGITVTATNGAVIAQRMLIALNAPESGLGSAEHPFPVRILTSVLTGG